MLEIHSIPITLKVDYICKFAKEHDFGVVVLYIQCIEKLKGFLTLVNPAEMDPCCYSYFMSLLGFSISLKSVYLCARDCPVEIETVK